MDVFDLSRSLVYEYEAFSRSFVAIRSEKIRKKVEEGYSNRRFWPAPLLQINPHYKSGGRLSRLVGEPEICAEAAAIFRAPDGVANDLDPSLKLHRHQAQAIKIALSRIRVRNWREQLRIRKQLKATDANIARAESVLDDLGLVGTA